VSFLVAILAWKRKNVAGAQALSFLMMSAGVWAFFVIFETASTTMEEKLFWSKIAYLGAVTSPVLYFIFVLYYTGIHKFSSLRSSILLFIIPAITFVLALTNEKHHLIWTGFSPISPVTNLLRYEHGVGYWLGYVAYNYLLLVFATYSLTHFILRNRKTFRLQGVFVLIAGFCPWIAGVVYLTNANPIPGFDLAPVSMIVSGVILIIAMYGTRFLDLVPIAREVLVETLQDGIVVLDDKNRVQDINAAALTFLGIEKKKILALPLESSGATVTSLLNAVVSSKSVEQLDVEVNQKVKSFSISKLEIKSPVGSRLVVIRDISELVARQKELHNSEERYRKMYTMFRLLADNMPDMLWAKDLENRFIFVNKAICTNLLNANDICEPIGKTNQFFTEREQQKCPECSDWFTIGSSFQESEELVISSGKSEFFEESGYRNGEFLILDVNKAPILDESGQMIGIVGSGRDVTLQKKAEQELFKRDKLLNAISKATAALVQGDNLEENMVRALEIIGKVTEISRICVYRNVLDSENNKTFLNRIMIWRDSLLDSKKSIDLSETDLESSFPDWYKRLLNREVVSGKASDFAPSEKIMLESHDIKSILLSPIFIDEQFWGFLSFNDCQTERIWTITEEHLLTSVSGTIGTAFVRRQDQLELIKAKEKAEESDRLKTAFLSNISHEIRTPMNGILGFISLLQESDLTSEEKEEYMILVKAGGERLLNTINDIIDISKIESGQMSVSYVDFNLNELIFNLYTLYSAEAETLGLEFVRPAFFEDSQSAIKSDKDKIFCILNNLINNAFKYTHAGSVEYGCSRTPGNILFYVKDTGIGISKTMQHSIFNRFVQADISITRSYEGSGLGLSISKAFVELLGGRIWVESEVEKGSIFYFQIPVIESDFDSNQTKNTLFKE